MKKPGVTILLFTCMMLLFNGYNSCFCQAFETGQVMDTVSVRSDRSESYALFLPHDYADHSHYPVIYFFEPLGRGSLPLHMYKDLAEELGLIMICSNNSRNGAFDRMEPIARRLFSDTQTRFSIDTGHIYFAGFSGGSKLAFRLAQDNPAVSAVIGCGACYPVAGLPKNRIPLIYCNIVGTSDMNYYPMFRNKNMLDSLGFHSYLICFGGGHTWPPAEIFSEALWWTMFRDNLKGKESIPDHYALIATSINKALEENAFYSASLRALEMKEIFTNTAFEIQADSILQRIMLDPLFSQQIKTLNRIAKTEASFQDDIYDAFLGILSSRYNQTDTVHTASWWKSQYKRCQRLITGRDPEKQKLGKRMDELIVASSYEQGEAFMAERDYKSAAMVYDIFILFRPDSHYGYLQLARCYKGLNQPQKAEKYLEITRMKKPEINDEL